MSSNTPVERVNAADLYRDKAAKLEQEVAALRLELITRVGELQAMSEEKDSLNTKVEELESAARRVVHESLIGVEGGMSPSQDSILALKELLK